MRKMLALEVIADLAGKISTFGVGGQEVTILCRREVQVAIDFAAMKDQVERTLGRNICG